MRFPRTAVTIGLLLAGSPSRSADTTTPALREFEVAASRFQFEPTRLEVREGDRVRITLRSADGTHGFAVKEFKVKQAIPKGGEPVVVEFVADKAGTFVIACSEYCGPGHRDMKAKLVVTARAGR